MFYQDDGGVRATNDQDENEPMIYYLGVIDILTPYNWYKKAEHFFRSFQYDKVSVFTSTRSAAFWSIVWSHFRQPADQSALCLLHHAGP